MLVSALVFLKQDVTLVLAHMHLLSTCRNHLARTKGRIVVSSILNHLFETQKCLYQVTAKEPLFVVKTKPSLA